MKYYEMLMPKFVLAIIYKSYHKQVYLVDWLVSSFLQSDALKEMFFKCPLCDGSQESV